LSYPIYLCHIAVLQLGTVGRARQFWDGGWFTLALIAATVAVAICYVRLIDAPFERWRQRRAERKLPTAFEVRAVGRS
jgi:peptidoglycan/LPS O-acetylase OafA/YrhL